MASDESVTKDGGQAPAAAEERTGTGTDTDTGGGAVGQARERRDPDGLPLDRAPTLDDVRGESGSGRSIAWGCSLLVVLALAGFWLVRAFLLG